jgi:hypothetical protein
LSAALNTCAVNTNCKKGTKVKCGFVAGLILLTASAFASQIQHFECRAVGITPPEPDSYDPIVQTVLTIAADRERLTYFAVEHQTLRGAVQVRQQQYVQQSIWIGKDDSDNWRGRSIIDPTLTMVGTLSDGPAGLFYVERLLRLGRNLETTIIYQCQKDLRGRHER